MIVGTAVYQVARAALMSSKNVVAWKRPPRGTYALPPVARVASSPAISPWPWCSGITNNVASCSSRR